MMSPTDVRLIDNPMQPLGCRGCTASVLVRKSNWQQTSIQWNETAQAACRERALSSRGESSTVQFPGCETLAESFRSASLEGTIDVINRDVPES